MEINRIFQLLDAGYSREQIEAFEKGMEEAKPKEQKGKPENSDEQKEKPENSDEQKEKPISDEAQAIIDNLNNQISELTKSIQNMNVKNRTFNNDVKQTADDVLADIFGKAGK